MMKSLFHLIAAFATVALLGLATGAQAGDCASSCGGEKVAKAECGEKKEGCGEQSACADKTACASGEKVAMAKGGAADASVVVGYGLDQKVPNFTLTDTNGKVHNLTDYAGKPVVIVFWNQNCPFVVEMQDRFAEFTKTYTEKGVAVLAIDAGVNNSEAELKTYAATRPFPLLVDRSSKIAVDFAATRTPEVFLLNKDGVVVYTGAFDNGQQGKEPGTRKTYLEDAVKAVLAGGTPEVRQTKAFGCTIKFAK